jgi:hypothetical protein
VRAATSIDCRCSFCGAASYLNLAVERAANPLSCQIALAAAAEGTALSTLALHGTVLYGMKKAAAALRALEARESDLPVRAEDIADLLLQGPPAARLPAACETLRRVQAAVVERAALDPAWAEAPLGLAAAASLPTLPTLPLSPLRK